MQFARRAFLRALPGAVAAAPIVAKAAADELIGKQAGLDAFNALGIVSGGTSGIDGPYPPASPSHQGLIKNFFLKFGMPDFARDRLWEDTGVSGLDPDIAAKRSWSMSVKILTQRQRNFQQRIDREQRNWGWADARDMFEQKHGFRFRW